MWSPSNFADSNTIWSWIHTLWLKAAFSWLLYFWVVACFHSDTVLYGSALNVEPNYSINIYLIIRSSYCRVPFTYHISWNKCSQKPQNLASISDSIHNLNKKCRNITVPPPHTHTISKAMQPRQIGKEWSTEMCHGEAKYLTISGSTWSNHMC